MYGDVNVSVQDYVSSDITSGIGTHFKIGVSNIVSSTPIRISGTMTVDDIKTKLGYTPLADACLDAVEWGAKTIYCIPIKPTTQGTVGNVTHNGIGCNKLTASGKPHNIYNVIVEIMESGAINDGAFRYSIDGGVYYSDDITIPLSKEFELPNTGITIKFDASDTEIYKVGDIFVFDTTPPVANNQAVIDAVNTLKHNNTAFEFVHIVGASTRALWAALAATAQELIDVYKRPCFFVCEARQILDSETITDYVEAMQEEQKGINSCYVQVVCSYSSYLRSDGRIMQINNAGIISGLYGAARVSQSIGEVKSFAISRHKLLQLLPVGIDEHIKTLDAAKYTTIRQYYGKDDYYVTSARMLAPDKSYYPYAEDVRVLNQLITSVRNKALEELQTEIDTEELDASIAILEAQLNIPIEDAIADGIITSGSAQIDKNNLNLEEREEIDVIVTYKGLKHIRGIDIVFTVSTKEAVTNEN